MLHLYAFNLICTIVVGVGFLLMFLVYLRFSPKDTLVVLLTPICFLLRIPYVIPLVMGLVGTPVSAVSIACGAVVYYMLHFVTQNVSSILAMVDEEMTVKFKYVVDGVLNNREMIITIAAFAVTVILVYLIRRLSIDYAWTIAMAAGVVVNIMVLLVGDLMFDTNVALLEVILGNILSLFVAAVLQFFVFNVDYSRTEKVQFEDDEYYYYVKAVPKISVSRPEKKVKQINSQKNRTSSKTRSTH